MTNVMFGIKYFALSGLKSNLTFVMGTGLHPVLTYNALSGLVAADDGCQITVLHPVLTYNALSGLEELVILKSQGLKSWLS